MTEYLTVDQVAKQLQVDPATVYRWAKADRTMPVFRIGGVVRFPRERLEAWLRAREQGEQHRRYQVLSSRKSAPAEDSAHG
jgi:excisionase family DNA binding protein